MDPLSQYSGETARLIAQREADAHLLGLPRLTVTDHDLLVGVEGARSQVMSLVREGAADSIILDVTSLPKRFFFLLLRTLYDEQRVRNLAVTYTSPMSYPRDPDRPLSEDHSRHANLPGFLEEGNERPLSRLIVGVGFAPLGLAELLGEVESMEDVRLELLMPYPPGPPTSQLNWRFVQNMERAMAGLKERQRIWRVDAHDMWGAFDRIVAITESGSQRAWLAPFGPKPVSIAMALYGTLYDAPAYYCQPRRYRPDYSIGVGMATCPDGNRAEASYIYPLRLDGRSLAEPRGRGRRGTASRA